MQSSIVYTKYPEECDFNGKRVLNLGCGFAKYAAPNVVNLDAYENCSPDVVHDLSKMPLPFKDGEFDFIIANHIMEHIPNWWACFEECARVVKPGGCIEVWVPGSGSDSVMGFRDHINTINHWSWYGVKGTDRGIGNAWAKKNCGGHASKLELRSYMNHLEREWWLLLLPQCLQKWCAIHLRNVIYEVGFSFVRAS